MICSTTEQVRSIGLFPVWCHKLICMHGYKDLIRCKSVCDVKPGIDPSPLLARSWNRWWPDFVTFAACKKSRFSLKRSSAFRTGAKIYLSKKNILGLGALYTLNSACYSVCDFCISIYFYLFLFLFIYFLSCLSYSVHWHFKPKPKQENQI